MRSRVLFGAIVSNADVVVQYGRVHAGVVSLLIAQQRGPVQIITKEAVAVGKHLVRSQSETLLRRCQAQESSQHSGDD